METKLRKSWSAIIAHELQRGEKCHFSRCYVTRVTAAYRRRSRNAPRLLHREEIRVRSRAGALEARPPLRGGLTPIYKYGGSQK